MPKLHYIVSFDSQASDVRYDAVTARLGGANVQPYIQYGPKYRPFSVKEKTKQLFEFIKKSKKGDVAFVFGGEFGIQLWFVCKLLFQKRTIITQNLIFDPARINFSRMGRIKRWMYKKAFSEGDFYATINSDGLIPIYSKLFACNEDRFVVVNDPMSISDNMLALSKEPRDCEYVFCGGKALRDLSCFARVVKRLPDINFVGIFSGNMLTDELRSLPNLKLLHDVDGDTFNRYLCKSTVCCIPLKSIAPCGLLVMQQAALMGIPIVSCDTPSMRTVVPDDTYSFLCKQGDDEAMAGRIVALLSSESLRLSMGSKLKENMKKYTPEIVGEQLADAIEKIMNH